MKRTATRRHDRRVERTRTRLLETMLELMVEKGYDRTTIQDILTRADVGRATFYSHFYNKKDLLFGRMSLFQLNVDDTGALRMVDVTHIFRHLAEYHELYPAMRGTEAMDEMLAIARADLSASFRKLLHGRNDVPLRESARAASVHDTSAQSASAHHEFVVQLLTGALLHLMFWWLDEGMPETPETMNARFAAIGARVLDERSH